MNQGRKISLIAIFAIMLSSFSLMVSYGVITVIIDNNETPLNKEIPILKPELKVKDIRDIKLTNELDKFTIQPAIVNNKVKYALNLNDINSSASFYINLINEGKKEATISEVKIKGIENYKNNIEIEVIGAKIGDIIPANSSLNNIEISTKYISPLFDETTQSNLIELDLIEIEFVYE